ncbi:uncharacterized protein ACWYII_027147 [Salvelinus alpinus]
MSWESCRQEALKLTLSPVGGPGHGQQPFTRDKVPTNKDIEAAIAVFRYSADEDTVREKMKTTFPHRQAMVNDADKSADVFSVFHRYLDIPGLIKQKPEVLFCEATTNTFLEKWPATFKGKVMKENHGLTPTTELLELMLSQLLKSRMAGTVTWLLSCCCYICYHQLRKVVRSQERCLHVKR